MHCYPNVLIIQYVGWGALILISCGLFFDLLAGRCRIRIGSPSPSIELAGLGFAGEHQLAYRVITTKCPHETDGGPYCAHRAIRRDQEKESVVVFEKKIF